MVSDYILRNSKSFLKWASFYVFGRSLLKASRFHATSDAEYRECRKLIPGWDGYMIPNIVWLPPLHISKSHNKIFTIIFLSRIHPKKGIELLMEAVSGINTPLIIKIAGSGEDKYIATLKRKAKALGIAENVHWLGWQNREKKFAELMQADLFALTSYNENFGNVVVEALYAGTPVLVSDETGLSDFVAVHKLGWVCKPRVKDIQSTLREAIKDKLKREEISKHAVLIIQRHFSEKEIIPQYIRHYQC
jgi:glycosyltransferase involved in cell wall biosynthesis